MAYSALIDDLERQFAENPRRVFARLANEYRKSGELERAIEICQIHVPQQPGYISGYIVMGQALFESGRLDEAHATFQTALDLDPENLIALRHLGDIARQTGDLDGARIWYQRLLEIDPQNEEIALQMSELSAATPEASSVPEQAAAPLDWGEINPEQETTQAVLEPEPVEDDTEPVAGADLEVLDGADQEPFDATVADALAEHEPLDLHAEGSLLDAHLAAAIEAPVDHAELPHMHEDFGTRDIIPETDPFAQPEELRPPSIAELSFEGDAVVEMASLDSRDVTHEDAASAAEPPRAQQDDAAHDATEEAGDSTQTAFVTETMAELYLEQGYRQEALQIFRQLSEQDPDSDDLRSRVHRLAEPEEGLPTASDTVAEATPTRARPERTIRHFLAALADRRPPRQPAPREYAEARAWAQHDDTTPSTFGAGVSPHEEAAAHSLAAAFSEDYLNRRGGAGQPARVASNELSLDQVFRDPRSREEAQSSRAVSFDEFFAPRAMESASGENGEGAQPEQPKPSSDLELFHAWLEGLKK